MSGGGIIIPPATEPLWRDFSSADTVFYADMDGGNGATVYTEKSPNLAVGSFVKPDDTRLSNAQAKFGPTSYEIDSNAGTTANLRFPNASYWDISGDFTISLWYYRRGAGGISYETLFNRYNPSNDNRAFQLRILTGSGGIAWTISTDGTAGTLIDYITTVPGDTHKDVGWHHLYLQRSGNDFGLWLDGAQLIDVVGTYTNNWAGAVIGTETDIGTYGVDFTHFNGWIDEVILAGSAWNLGGIVQPAALDIPGIPSFRATKSATTQTVVRVGDNNQEVVFDNEVFDTVGGFDINRYTIPAIINGSYINFVASAETVSGERHNIYIEVSTNGGGAWTEIATSGEETSQYIVATSGPWLANTGDVFRVRYELISGINAVINNTTQTFFSGYVSNS